MYTIREKAGSVEGVTYDTALYNAIVTVTDNGDGTLQTEVSCWKLGEDEDGNAADAAVDAVTFINKKEHGPSVLLPATGGSGTRPFRTAGLLLASEVVRDLLAE